MEIIIEFERGRGKRINKRRNLTKTHVAQIIAMSSIWRPYEESDDDEHCVYEAQEAKLGTSKQTRFRVGEKEKEMIMNSHLRNGEKWTSVLEDVKSRVEHIPMVNASLVQFYVQEDSYKVLRRIKRIVREESKMQALLYQKTQQNQHHGQRVHSTLTLQNCQDGQQQKQTNSNEPQKGAMVNKKMRYAFKNTPEERRKQKLKSFQDSDESESDAEQPAIKKKKTLREVSYEAQISHKQMCESASSSLSLMNDVLKKLDKKIDEL
ncbi:hypothetical protein AC249_AIPGENE6848 [Exaiptasia diaphana]|nr:hypothetical protein AC249_AIPGENE6848 [Exaiptasia diaphana]